MIERRTFFGQVLAFLAGFKLFGSRASEASEPKPTETLKVTSGPVSFVEMVQQNLPKDFFQEWGRQLQEDPSDATMWANGFLEMMRDSDNEKARQACSMFATLMKSRSWPEIQEVLKDSLDANTRAIFVRVEAEDFYNQFKAMVTEQIREYWEGFMASRRNKEDDSESAGEGVANG